MTDHKLEAAKAALKLIKPNQTIGLGAGTTIAHLVNLLAADSELSGTLSFTSSSFKTTVLLAGHGLNVKSPGLVNSLDIYFDGCDQFDIQLNALKCGGGIHTTEKILASMAREFIIIGDNSKFVPELDTTYPLVIEVIPAALQVVIKRFTNDFADININLRTGTQKDGAVMSDNGNMLLDVHFKQLPALSQLNTHIKMLPGVVEHSLFYQMASKAIIAGEEGINIVEPVRR
ncbi:ribose 5-phosphate isomerase A [Mucilaginibacter gynuensis]|uniref:Ribose 5-phosphate isomerase A n=1 Tax=Mucilaginibacter gynuensis TaxID=1302236 RepID=A0ABP8G441_9SPHI